MLALCPGRLNAIESLPPEDRDKDSQASIDGTRRHALSEYRKRNPGASRPQSVLVDGEQQKVTDEDWIAVSILWPYFRDHPAFPGNHEAFPGYFGVEERVEIGKYCGLPEGVCWGTADTIAITKDEIEIIDEKHGHILVEPLNLQNKAYAVGAAAKMFEQDANGRAHIKPGFQQVKTVKLTIAQPTNQQAPISSVVFPLTHLEKWAKEIGELGRRALDPSALRIPGEKQCKYCPAGKANRCPERYQHVASVMFEALSPGETPMVETPELQLTPGPAPIASVDTIASLAEVRLTQPLEEIPVEQLGRLLDQLALIEGWAADVRSYAEKLDAKGERIPGWKRVAGKSSREWVDDEDKTAAGLRSCGVSKEAMYVRKLVSPAQAEKVEVGRKNKVLLIQDKARSAKLQKLWRKKEGKPTLVPESDPRPALNVGATMFEKLDEGAAPDGPENLPSWY